MKFKTPRDDPVLAEILALLGRCLLHAEKPPEAEPVLRECLAIREKKNPDDWARFNTKPLLGKSLFVRNKFADAEPLLLAGYDGMKQHEAQIPTEDKIRLTEALARLVQLYDTWGKKDKADTWRKKWAEAKAAAKPATKP